MDQKKKGCEARFGQRIAFLTKCVLKGTATVGQLYSVGLCMHEQEVQIFLHVCLYTVRVHVCCISECIAF